MKTLSDSAAWPPDGDGDALRRIAGQGLDFSSPHLIDFTVDFEDWPPPMAALAWLDEAYPGMQVFDPDAEFDGYVLVQVTDLLSYDFVVETQRRITEAMACFGGVCESWGLLHDPAH